MISFNVADMTCAHCTSTIATAVESVDAAASVNCDLSTHQVAIESTRADALELAAAIAAAGHTTRSLTPAIKKPYVA